MKIQLRGVGYGVTDSGQWVAKDGGKWVPCNKPAWANRPATASQARATLTLVMADPEQREEPAPTVNVRRVIRKTVPDYEAAVLLRNGWELDE